ncbi:MAG: tRNA (N6-isopentenyl adenosine(37)-C2)-methylthiotransferase MiaB [bacterium]|nr:tRNA (N6-isopentenyl adenosine(37)-C2)-methylthiotransferase MiaB [bacterium]
MPGRFHIRTFGCQMNQHDAEKMANLLHHEGYAAVSSVDGADVVLIHTCSVRDKAEQKLYSELGSLLAQKDERPDLIVGVGGCVAQQEGGALLKRFPKLDFVFGPQNLVHLPSMVESAIARERSLRVDYDDDRQARFELPERHPEFQAGNSGRAFVTVMEGCDLFCTYCIVPATRGREVSRSSEEILAEASALANRGVIELTLLGQTVNAYGRARPGRVDGELRFATLIRRVAEIAGIERVRFTSPHPIFMTEDLIGAYGEVPELCPHIHLPVQSGSTRVLEAMSRRYSREDYLRTAEALRTARPDLAISTDLIVGFPGESRSEFEETLSLVSEVRFVDSYSFKYSERPGTPAQRRGLQSVEPDEAQDRLERLQALQKRLTLEAHQARVGSRTTVLVDGASRRGGERRQGRDPYNRVVNFTATSPMVRGVLCDIDVTAATPHSLLGVAEGDCASGSLPLR